MLLQLRPSCDMKVLFNWLTLSFVACGAGLLHHAGLDAGVFQHGGYILPH